MNRAMLGRSDSKCGDRSALPITLAATRSFCVDDDGRDGEAAHARPQGAPGALTGAELAGLALGGCCGRGGPGQIEQVGAPHVAVLEQCSRHGVEDVRTLRGYRPALEYACSSPGSPRRSLGNFPAPQARDPAFAAESWMPACAGVTLARRETRNSRMSFLLGTQPHGMPEFSKVGRSG